MSRNASALTSKTTKTARRINRQAKNLEKDILSELHLDIPIITLGAKSCVIQKSNIKHIEPLTDNQKLFFDNWESDVDAFALYGSAGTGKTYIALYLALREILSPDTQYSKIIIIRSCVQSRQMGFTKGSEIEKMEPYEAIYISMFAELLGKKDSYQKLKDLGKLEFLSTSFLRGSTFRDCIIIFDEAQNENFEGISTVCTRVGENTRLLVIGDSKQNDLRHTKNDVSGFLDFISVAYKMPEFRCVKFTIDDIVRSGFVKSWLMQCEKLGLSK